SGTPFGGDDTGDLPVAQSATAKCENTVNKLVGKAVACIIKCHNSVLSGKLVLFGNEDEPCENFPASIANSCLSAFMAGVQNAQFLAPSPGCNCIDPTSLFTTIEGVLDSGNDLTYCASPSGAFLQ